MRFFLPFVALLLAFAAAAETNELDLARQALRDGLWKVARTHAERASGEAARLVVLESMAREGDWKGVGSRLASWPDAKGDVFDYYRAAAAGDTARAIALLKKSGWTSDAVEARMLEADLLSRAGDSAAARKLWNEVVSQTNVPARAFITAASNLGDTNILRKAYSLADTIVLRRLAGLRLGLALLRDPSTLAEGSRLLTDTVKDAPDMEGARAAYLNLAETLLAIPDFQQAERRYREIVEIWPDTARLAKVQEGRGWALAGLGRLEESLVAFERAEELADNDDLRALALFKQGDVLTSLGRNEESMARYRRVLEKYPRTDIAEKIARIVRTREKESEGRSLYRDYRFVEAEKIFSEVAKEDPARRAKMDYFIVLCLYGRGLEDEACRRAEDLAKNCSDVTVRAQSMLWLAKVIYNRGEWKAAGKAFLAFVEAFPSHSEAPEALTWAARAAYSSGDCTLAIQLVTRLVERYPDSPFRSSALMVQGEALIELARFDEAILVLESVADSEKLRPSDRARIRTLRADALFAMGADNPIRYQAALEAYQAVRFGGTLSFSEQLSVSFRIARTLEKLRRIDEATDQYYTQVVLAYLEGRGKGLYANDDARAAFSRAAFRLADEYENRGSDFQAQRILELVVNSDVPAAKEARRRLERIKKKGGFL